MSDQDINDTVLLEEELDQLIQELSDDLDPEQPEQSIEQQEEEENEDTTTVDTTMSTQVTSNVDQTLKNIFANTTALTDGELASELTVHKKEERANMDTKTLHRIRDAATRALEKKLRVQSALGTGTEVTGEESDLETTEVASVFAANTHVVDKISQVVKEYDLSSATEIRLVVDENKTHPSERYGTDTVDLLQEIGTHTLEQVKEYSGDVMLYDQKDGVYRQNLQWLLMLMRNNVSSSISNLIEPTFEKLEPKYQNGAVYLKMALDFCFMIDDHVIEALCNYIVRFGKTGLAGFEGENVLMAKTAILAICRRLDQLEELPKDAGKDVLKGLIKCTYNYDFKAAFQLIYNLENQSVVNLTNTKTEKDVLARIEAYFQQAVTLYTSAILSEKWHSKRAKHSANQFNSGHTKQQLTNMIMECWNCKGNHNLKECKEPLNQAEIDKNKKAYFEKKRQNGGEEATPKQGGKTGGYTRSGFGGKEGGTNGVIVTSTGEIYTSCKFGTQADGCGLNKTHSSKYHSQWKANKSTFVLPSSHPYMVALAKGGKCLPCASPGQDSGTGVQAAITAALQQFKAEQSQRLATLETQSDNPDISNAAGLLKSLFQ